MTSDKAFKPIPVCLISGFLGAGKTTLLNNILNADHGLNITVMVNDFGAIDIDSQLLSHQDENSITLKNGCICCSLQNDLVDELKNLLLHPAGAPEYVVIECSGVSDPSKILNTLRYPQVREHFQIDTVVSLINAQYMESLEGEVKHLVMAQLDAADIIIINKIDTVMATDIQQIHRKWLYPEARVIETSFAQVPMHLIFSSLSKNNPRSKPKYQQLVSHDVDHSALFQSWSWSSKQLLCIAKLRALINQLPNSIYRAKGIFYTREYPNERIILQMVGARQEWSKDKQFGAQKQSQLVMIASRDKIDKQDMQSSLDACRDEH